MSPYECITAISEVYVLFCDLSPKELPSILHLIDNI